MEEGVSVDGRKESASIGGRGQTGGEREGANTVPSGGGGGGRTSVCCRSSRHDTNPTHSPTIPQSTTTIHVEPQDLPTPPWHTDDRNDATPEPKPCSPPPPLTAAPSRLVSRRERPGGRERLENSLGYQPEEQADRGRNDAGTSTRRSW